MLKKLFKRLFCEHRFEHVRNIYGDEINRVSLRHVYRSVWQCSRCGKVQYLPDLFRRRT